MVLAASRRLQKHFKLKKKKKKHHNFDDLTPNYVYSCGFLIVSKYQVAKLTHHHQKAAANPPEMQAMQETGVQFLGTEDPLEEETTTHSSILAWEIPWTEEPGRLQSIALQSQT